MSKPKSKSKSGNGVEGENVSMKGAPASGTVTKQPVLGDLRDESSATDGNLTKGKKKEKKSMKRKREEATDTGSDEAAILAGTNEAIQRKSKKSKKNYKDDEVEDVKVEVPKKEKESRKENKDEKRGRKEKKRKTEKNRDTREASELARIKDREHASQEEIGTPKSDPNPRGIDNGAATSAMANENSEAVATKRSKAQQTEDHQGRKVRFIAFIGQLPYTATVDAIAKHFEKISPSSIRLQKRKDDPSLNQGFAFLEFDNYDRMKTCLKLYHRTTLDDGISPPRKIKVELTAGGGGSNEQRKEKIKQKNDKLTEERRRRAIEEAQQKLQQDTKKVFRDAKSDDKRHKNWKGGPRSGPRIDQQLQQNAAAEAPSATVDAHDGIHPDRLARLQ